MVNRFAPRHALLALAAVASASFVHPTNANAQARLINGFGGPADFGVDQLDRGDDLSSAPIDLTTAFPAGITLNGQTFTSVFVNTNGNLSFGSSLMDFTPVAFPGATVPIVSAWWADVDTRFAITTTETDGVYWHIESGLFVATWSDVGYFDQHRDLRNSFQIVMRDATLRGGAPGDVDLEFRYNRCEWTTGDASGGDGGVGGTIAFAGYDFTAVSGGSTSAYSVLPGSGTPAVLGLCTDSNINDRGVWTLQVRSGVVTYCGNGVVDPGEECDPASDPTCASDCHFCTPTTCPGPDGGFPDVPFEDVPFPDVPPFDASEFDVPPFDANKPDAPTFDTTEPDASIPDVVLDDTLHLDAVNADAMDGGVDADASARTVNHYGGGGLVGCTVARARSGRTNGRTPWLFVLVATAFTVARSRRRRRP